MGKYSLSVRDKSQIAEGSLSDIVIKQGVDLAEAFAGAKRIILLDVSGSMEAYDVQTSSGPITRHDAAEEQVRRLQKEHSGKVALFCFSDNVVFCPDGVPRRLNAGTSMGLALSYIKTADDMGIGIDLITDGEPTDGEQRVLEIATGFRTPINAIYIGPEGGYGYAFIQRLSSVTGGHAMKTKDVGIFYEEEKRFLLSSG